MNHGTYIFIINGELPKGLSQEWQKFFVGLWMFAMSLTCIVSPVEFIFRYLLVVKEYTVSYAWLIVMAGVVVLVSLCNSAFLYAAVDSVRDYNATFGHLMSDEMWTDQNGGRAVYYGAHTVRNRPRDPDVNLGYLASIINFSEFVL